MYGQTGNYVDPSVGRVLEETIAICNDIDARVRSLKLGIAQAFPVLAPTILGPQQGSFGQGLGVQGQGFGQVPFGQTPFTGQPQGMPWNQVPFQGQGNPGMHMPYPSAQGGGLGQGWNPGQLHGGMGPYFRPW